MATPPTRWRTVGPHWSSVKPARSNSSPASTPASPASLPGGMHSSYLHALSRPDLNLEYEQTFKNGPPPANSTTLAFPSLPHQGSHLGATMAALHSTDTTLDDHQRALQHHHENQRQQQLYLQQLQLMQRLQSMPGSTTRPWYPTFGPAITTSCSDSTILLDNPHQFTLINNAKLNRQAVGPHWRSIQTSATYSPTPSPPPSSPRFSSLTISSKPNPGVLSHHPHQDQYHSPNDPFARHSPTSPTSHNSSSLTGTTFSSVASTLDPIHPSSFRPYERDSVVHSTEIKPSQGREKGAHFQHSPPPSPCPHREFDLPTSPGSRAKQSNPQTMVLTRQTSLSLTMKRKAVWQDEEGPDQTTDSHSLHQDQPSAQHFFSPRQGPLPSHPQQGVEHDQDLNRVYGHESLSPPSHPEPSPTLISPLTPHTSSPSTTLTTHSSRNTPGSSVAQLVPAADSSLDQDQEMASADFSEQGDLEVISTMSVDLDPDQEEQDRAQGRHVPQKRTKPRLDLATGSDRRSWSDAETQRAISGEQVRDIFQECFYNAAASRS